MSRIASARLAFLSAACVLVPLAGLGCANRDRDHGYNSSSESLYNRLGGEKAITAVVSDFVDRIAADPKVNITRAGTMHPWDPTPANVAKVKRLLTEQLCNAAGGPQKYTGRDMRSAHRGMQITDAEFDAAGAHLKTTLDKFNVPKREQDEVFQIVLAQRKDVVGV